MDDQKFVNQPQARIVSRPAGGFRPMGVPQILMAWWAYRTGLLKYLDFRVYLALHEVDERRQATRRMRVRRGAGPSPAVLTRKELVAELLSIMGGTSERTIRAGLRRLETLRLVTSNERGLVFAGNAESLAPESPATLRNALRNVDLLTNGTRRRIPVPRPMLRYLSRKATPALCATVFGHLLCSVRWAALECRIAGTCTARRVSDLFGVDIRSIRRGRSLLQEVGWLVRDSGAQVVENLRPSLDWTPRNSKVRASSSRTTGTDLSPLRRERCTDLSPTAISLQLRSGSKYQQPAAAGPVGDLEGIQPERRRESFHVTEDDLRNPRKLLGLFDRAVIMGFVKGTEADRLLFFAAAERAKRVATRNPCGFFAAIVRTRRWGVLSQLDEDRARLLLRKLESCGEPSELFSASNDPNGSKVVPVSSEPLLASKQLRRLVAGLAEKCSFAPGDGRPASLSPNRRFPRPGLEGAVRCRSVPMPPTSQVLAT